MHLLMSSQESPADGWDDLSVHICASTKYKQTRGSDNNDASVYLYTCNYDILQSSEEYGKRTVLSGTKIKEKRIY